jgi:hypothetical protein
MKRLSKTGIQYLTFVKDKDFVTDGLFTLIFYKTVGDEVLTISSLSDENGLPNCFPYITLEVDLDTYSLAYGEYLVELQYNGSTYVNALIEVFDGLPDAEGGSDAYRNVVKLKSLPTYNDHLLMEDGFHLLLEDGNEIEI